MANEKQIRARQQQKHDIEANWITAGENGFIPKAGEIIIYDVDETHDKPRLKIGDGVNNVTALEFLGANAIVDLPIVLGEGENSLIGNDVETNKALGAYSTASGEQTIAGGKGYKITYAGTVTDEDNNISVNNIGFEIGSLTEQEFLNTCNWQEGDIFSVSVDEYYQWDFCGTLTGAPRFDEGTVYWSCITTDYGDKKLSDLADPEFTSTHISVIYVPTKPCGTITVGSHAHAEGYNTVAASRYAHAEGYQNQAGYCAHAEGQTTIAKGLNSHSEGYKTKATGATSHAEGSQTQAIGDISHAEGYKTKSSGVRSHAEGYQTIATGINSHSEGYDTEAIGSHSHAEGWQSKATGLCAHAEGYLTDSTGDYSHAEGNQTLAEGEAAHAEGTFTEALGKNSHAEGNNARAEGEAAHAEGTSTKALNKNSHAEGNQTLAEGEAAHAEGTLTKALGKDSHAEGNRCQAKGQMSHAEGQGTIASSACIGQHVQGKYNIEDTAGKYAHIVGNGGSVTRKNAHTLDWNGNAWFKGSVYVGSTKQTTTPTTITANGKTIYKSPKLPEVFYGTDTPENSFGANGDIYIKI